MRFVPIVFLISGFLTSCQFSPIEIGKPTGTGLPQIPAESSAVIFTCLVREVSVARSQGVPWFALLTDEDARNLKAIAGKLIAEAAHFQMIPDQAVRDHDLVRAGRFPAKEQFYLSPDENPIVRNPTEQELMLRTATVIGADYFIVILLDHSTSKVMLKPSSVTATAQVQIFHKKAGLIYARQSSATADALPYDRDLPFAQFREEYAKVLRTSAIQLLKQAMADLQTRMKSEIKVLPAEPGKNHEAGPVQI
ncbi:MAG: hypothetical protein K8S54_16355 [Spirochaetia bacterium]|nr:hypothetical protein [Spirochaetia bacterium]